MHSNHTGNYRYLQLAKKNHIRISNILKECSCIRIKEYPYSKGQCFCKYSNVFCKYSNVFCKCLDLTLYYNTMNTKHLNNLYCITFYCTYRIIDMLVKMCLNKKLELEWETYLLYTGVHVLGEYLIPLILKFAWIQEYSANICKHSHKK